jgi:hypothetical protein
LRGAELGRGVGLQEREPLLNELVDFALRLERRELPGLLLYLDSLARDFKRLGVLLGFFLRVVVGRDRQLQLLPLLELGLQSALLLIGAAGLLDLPRSLFRLGRDFGLRRPPSVALEQGELLLEIESLLLGSRFSRFSRAGPPRGKPSGSSTSRRRISSRSIRSPPVLSSAMALV